MTFGDIDQSVALAVGTAVLLGLVSFGGYFTKRWVNSESDYIIASREISTILLMLGVFAFGFNPNIAVLYAVFSMTSGYFTAIWLGVIYVAWIAYGLFLTPFVRTVGTQTITEWYEIRFNYPTRAVISLSQIVGLIFAIASGVLAAASILQGYAGWDIRLTSTIILAVILFIDLSGGIWGVTVSDAMQTIFGLVVFPSILLYLLFQFGGIGWIAARIPEQAVGFDFPGGWELMSLGHQSYLTWGMLWFIAFVFGASIYWTRAATARSTRTAQAGFIGAGVLGLFLMVLIMPMLGMYAFALAPTAFSPAGGDLPPASAFGVLANELPLLLAALLPIGFLAAAISTHTTDVIGGTAMLMTDLYHRLFKPKDSSENFLLQSRAISFCIISFSFLVTFLGNVQFLVSTFLSLTSVSSVIVLLDQYWKGFTPLSAFAGSCAGIGLALGWTFIPPPGWIGIHPIWVAIGATVGVGYIGSHFTPKKYYNTTEWRADSDTDDTVVEPIDLSEEHLAVLRSIYLGGDRFSDLLDTLQLESHLVNRYVEELDERRYITRNGRSSYRFYTFSLTDRGEQVLHDREHRRQNTELWNYNLDREMVDALSIIKSKPGSVSEEVAKALNESISDTIAVIQRLLKLEYIEGSGLFRQRFHITHRGRSVLDSYSEEFYGPGQRES